MVFVCQYCPYRNAEFKRLVAHHASVHSGMPVPVKPPRQIDLEWRCPQCNKRLANKFNLQRHLRTHNQPVPQQPLQDQPEQAPPLHQEHDDDVTSSGMSDESSDDDSSDIPDEDVPNDDFPDVITILRLEPSESKPRSRAVKTTSFFVMRGAVKLYLKRGMLELAEPQVVRVETGHQRLCHHQNSLMA